MKGWTITHVSRFVLYLLQENANLKKALAESREQVNTEIEENVRLGLENATLLIQLGAGPVPNEEGIQDE